MSVHRRRCFICRFEAPRCWDRARPRNTAPNWDVNPGVSARDVRCHCDLCPFLCRFCPESSSFSKQPTEDPHDIGPKTMEGISFCPGGGWSVGDLKGPGALCDHSAGHDALPLLSGGIQGEKNTVAHQGQLKRTSGQRLCLVSDSGVHYQFNA